MRLILENYVGIKGIKRLIGLIQGINADYVINKEELKYLRDWLNEQENYENIGQYKVIIKKIKDIIKDGVISKEEKDLILKICKDINENILNANDGFLKLLILLLILAKLKLSLYISVILIHHHLDSLL